MTAGEKVFASWASLVGHLQAMSLPQVGINLALTAVIVVAAQLSVGHIRKLARVAARQLPAARTADRTVRASRVHRVNTWAARLLAGAVALMPDQQLSELTGHAA